MKTFSAGILLAFSAFSQAQSLSITLKDVDSGQSLGSVAVTQSDYGLVFTPALSGMTPGAHGFHVHENPSCDSAMKEGKKVAAGAAGSHYDPQNTGKHGQPWNTSAHLGDLPVLHVGENGEATQPVLAPRLTMKDLKGRALMVHARGDNYADEPQKLGGGGARVACGVIK